MTDGVLIDCDFSDEEFASIGGLVWAFCLFENELVRAALCLWANHEDTSDAASNDSAVMKVVEGTMRTRFRVFLRLAKRHFSPSDFPLLLHLEERFAVLEMTRNRICHGKWHKSADDHISFRFYDRVSTGQKIEPEVPEFSANVIRQYVGEVLAATAFISRASGTLSDPHNPFSAA